MSKDDTLTLLASFIRVQIRSIDVDCLEAFLGRACLLGYLSLYRSLFLAERVDVFLDVLGELHVVHEDPTLLVVFELFHLLHHCLIELFILLHMEWLFVLSLDLRLLKEITLLSEFNLTHINAHIAYQLILVLIPQLHNGPAVTIEAILGSSVLVSLCVPPWCQTRLCVPISDL